jgi:hypothetical protein
MSHVIITETGTCGFTLNAKVKHAPFACKQCGSRKFLTQLDMTAEAYPTGSYADGTCPVIYADMDVYAVSVECSECKLLIPGSGYTH